MKKYLVAFLLSLLFCGVSAQHSSSVNKLRAPAYPLVTIDPYTSAWSFSNVLYGDAVRHWTGVKHSLIGAIRVDQKTYRFMGTEDASKASTVRYFNLPAAQKTVSVMPTQTYYVFNCGPIQLDLTFCSPLLTDDLKTLSRPVNYISYKTSSLDGKPHNVQIYFEATPEWAVNNTSQEIQSSRFNADGLTFLKTGTRSQNILQTKGDNVRIDWGYFYLAGENNKQSAFTINDYRSVKKAFATTGSVAGLQPHQPNANMEKEMTALAFSENLGNSKTSSGKVMIGYDDIYSVQFYEKNLRAWWRDDNPNAIVDAFSAANKEYSSLINKCSAFDRKLMKEARSAGGENYADLCAIAYRQAIAAHKLVRGENGELYFFSKENFSNGSIGTVDVTYPSAPLFLYYNPDLLKGMMDPIFYAAESGKWNKPFPAHDSGTYPLANGQTYGEDMPVEEAGNMLILTAAIAKAEQNATYAEKHWQSLTTWADYLLQKGLDPENQLCTDDFAGHLAHNTNLSVKAIVGIAGYGHMAQMLGKDEIAQKYLSAAKAMAQKWTAMADAGDHFSLTFDKKDTWSQKYNMVWDKLLGYELFPSDLINRELAYYLTKQNQYGLPLDSRATYTKSDWITWTATLADDQGTFQKLIDPVYNAFNQSTSRIPMTDWYQTTDAKQVGFQARSVVGGYFIKMLKDKLNLQK